MGAAVTKPDGRSKGRGRAEKFLAPALLWLAAASPSGVPSGGAPGFAAVLRDPGHRALVLRAAEATPAWRYLGCPAARFAPAPEVAVYLPVVFGKDGAPVGGEWREGLIASGCGAPLTLNVLTRVTAPATLATGFLLPGGSIADPELQNAAQGFAVKAAGGVPAGCGAAFIADTEFAGYEGPAAPGRAWREIWTLAVCGPPLRVVMHFSGGAGAIGIRAEPAPGG